MKDIFYENCVLRNTNYYLLCTLYHLEKQKIDHFNTIIKESDELVSSSASSASSSSINDDNAKELLDLLKKKEDEYVVLQSELQNLKIEIEIQKEFTTHKIQNLESAKKILEAEIKEKEKHINQNPENEKLKRENIMLTINNKQLQFELIRSIKLRE
jgi:hypothetical protein